MLISSLSEALEAMLAASQSCAIQPHFLSVLPQIAAKVHAHRALCVPDPISCGAVLTLFIRRGFGSNPLGLCDRVPAAQFNGAFTQS